MTEQEKSLCADLLSYFGFGNEQWAEKLLESARIVRARRSERIDQIPGFRRSDVFVLLQGILRGIVVSQSGKELTECIVSKYGQVITMDHAGHGVRVDEQDVFPGMTMESVTESLLLVLPAECLREAADADSRLLLFWIRCLEESCMIGNAQSIRFPILQAVSPQ